MEPALESPANLSMRAQWMGGNLPVISRASCVRTPHLPQGCVVNHASHAARDFPPLAVWNPAMHGRQRLWYRDNGTGPPE